MFSEALKIMDQNMVQYMIEELQEENEKKDAALSERDSTIAKQTATIANQTAEIEALKRKIQELENSSK